MIIHNERIEQVWRRELISSTRGKILEVSAGTGENFKFYPPSVQVVATDPSERILRQAREHAAVYKVSATFIVQSVEELEFEPQNFDTIVSTLSLCAYQHPEAVVARFSYWCKRGGTVLLLEHGLSSWRVIRWLQLIWAPFHYRYAGCHLDLDIPLLLRNSPLKVIKMKKKLMGITRMIWAAPS